jgi:hypothetical protein
MSASSKTAVAVPAKRAVTNISTAWHKTIDALFETANLLYSYSQQANWKEIKEQLQADGVMGASVISMMLGIARDPRLQKPGIKKLLPPSYNTLYLLTKLDDNAIDAKIKDEVLTPSLTVEDVRQWSKPTGAATSSTNVDKLVVRLPNKFSARDRTRLLKSLQEVAAEYPGVKVQ